MISTGIMYAPQFEKMPCVTTASKPRTKPKTTPKAPTKPKLSADRVEVIKALQELYTSPVDGLKETTAAGLEARLHKAYSDLSGGKTT